MSLMVPATYYTTYPISYFSVAVIRCHDQSNLYFKKKNIYFGLRVPEGSSPRWLSGGSGWYEVGAAAGSSHNKL